MSHVPSDPGWVILLSEFYGDRQLESPLAESDRVVIKRSPVEDLFYAVADRAVVLSCRSRSAVRLLRIPVDSMSILFRTALLKSA